MSNITPNVPIIVSSPQGKPTPQEDTAAQSESGGLVSPEAGEEPGLSMIHSDPILAD